MHHVAILFANREIENKRSLSVSKKQAAATSAAGAAPASKCNESTQFKMHNLASKKRNVSPLHIIHLSRLHASYEPVYDKYDRQADPKQQVPRAWVLGDGLSPICPFCGYMRLIYTWAAQKRISIKEMDFKNRKSKRRRHPKKTSCNSLDMRQQQLASSVWLWSLKNNICIARLSDMYVRTYFQNTFYATENEKNGKMAKQTNLTRILCTYAHLLRYGVCFSFFPASCRFIFCLMQWLF